MVPVFPAHGGPPPPKCPSLPDPPGKTACPTYFAKRLIQQGGAGAFACRSNGHNQWSASKMNKFPKKVMHPQGAISSLQLAHDLPSHLAGFLQLSRFVPDYPNSGDPSP